MLKALAFVIILCVFLVSFVDANVYKVGDFYTISGIKVEGNKITKEVIIIRELLIDVGDTVLISDLDNIINRSRENVLNTGLFNFVTINQIKSNPGQIAIEIIVEERWYTWPYPILEHADRNFNTFVKDRSWHRINFGMYVSRYNFRGRREILKIKARAGYREQYGFIYSIPYLDKKQKNGIETEFFYFRQKEIYYKTENNHLLYYRSDNKYVHSAVRARINYSYRRRFDGCHNLSIGCNYGYVIDTIVKLNPEYYNSDQNEIAFLSASYGYTLDRRDSKVYPLKGYYLGAEAAKLGFGLLPGEINTYYLKGTLKKYSQIIKRFYYAGKLQGYYSSPKKRPYILNHALGFDNFLRGYEYYVIDGQKYLVLSNSLKLEIVPSKTKKIDLIPYEKFNKIHYSVFLTLFSDLGYIEDFGYNNKSNSLSDKLLYSFGLGVNLVTYYDWVFRLEYSLNRSLENGVYFHVGAAI